MLRGAWILENIIGTPPAAPPPDVEGFKENKEGEKARSVREIMEQHRSKPSCNACHGVMDPLGFALENFDAIGEWRSKDRYAGTVIDASGKLVDGTPVNSPADLRKALMKRPEQFVQTMTEKLMTYALGRSVEYYDMPAVRAIVRDAARDNYRFSSIVMGIVKSAPFQMRKGVNAKAESSSLQGARCRLIAGVIGVNQEPHVHHEEASFAPHVPPRRRRHRGPAAAGRDDPGMDRAGPDGGQSEAAHGVHVSAARRDHGSVDARGRGHELRADADPQAVRAVPEAVDDRQRTGEQRAPSRRRCTRSARAPG